MAILDLLVKKKQKLSTYLENQKIGHLLGKSKFENSQNLTFTKKFIKLIKEQQN